VGADVQAVVRQTERMAVRPQDVAAVMHSVGGQLHSVGGQLHSVGGQLHGVRGHVPSVGDLAARVGWGTLWVAR
jgi:predicted alpha/beta hydrolase